jgi:hypothetical protein
MYSESLTVVGTKRPLDTGMAKLTIVVAVLAVFAGVYFASLQRYVFHCIKFM